MEGQKIPTWNPDPPIADRGRNHRHPCVLDRPQQAQRHHLHRIRHLKQCRHRQQRDAKRNDFSALRFALIQKQRNNRHREAEKQHHHHRTKANRQRNRHFGRIAKTLPVSRAIRPPGSHRRRIRQPQMHHERQCRDLHGDAMRRQFNGANPAHHQRRRLKQPALGQRSHPNRPAQPEHLMQSLPVRSPKALEQMKMPQFRQPSGINRQGQGRQRLHQNRGYRRPAHAQFRRPPMAKDQRIGQHKVNPHRRQRHPQHHLRPL